jgi:TonB family protein
MRRVLAVVLFAACVSTCLARPSNYFYRISPAGAPLKEEPALSAKRPEYPTEARQQHLGGSGLFALHIRDDGSVASVEILRSVGYPALDQAAIAAFREWRFRPHSVSVIRAPITYHPGAEPAHPEKQHALVKLGDGVQIDVYDRR